MKKRENLRSSSTSSHRETTPENHLTRNIGCFSGFFHLISKYQHRRKFLTSSVSAANSDPERKSVSTCSSSSPSEKPKSAAVVEKTSLGFEFKRFSLDELRSPTIPSKIRLSSNSDDSSSSPKKLPRSPALVARLMGLDDIPEASPSPTVPSSVEKRRKLLEALEKCDEDLKVLKNIIETIKSSDSQTEVVQTQEGSVVKDHRWLFDDSMKKLEVTSNDEQPSPVSVLDQISDFSPSPSNCRRSTTSHHHQIGDKYKKLREETGNSLTNFHRTTFEALPVKINSGRKGSSSADINYQAGFEFQCSKSKVESVNEVCMDAVWAERWEIGRIGMVLEDKIFQMLIEEIVAELGCGYISASRLSRFGKCRKRLSF